jgi:hypothetical protein
VDVRLHIVTAASMKIRAFWDIVLLEHTDVSEVRTVPMIVVIEAVSTSETSVYSNETTRRYIPEGSDLRSRYLFI